MSKNEDSNSVNPVNQPSEKICKGKCQKLKPLSAYNNNRTKKDGKQEICRECQSDFMKDYNARKAYERRQQLTAGDIQLDPKPAPKVLPAGVHRDADVLKEEVISTPKKKFIVGSLSTPATRRVKLPDKKVEKQNEKADPTPGKVNLPMSTGVVFTAEEKRFLLVALEKYIGTIDGIIAKLK